MQRYILIWKKTVTLNSSICSVYHGNEQAGTESGQRAAVLAGKEDRMIENEYRHNGKFRAYVDKYCIANGVTVEQALKHELVRQVFISYTDV